MKIGAVGCWLFVITMVVAASGQSQGPHQSDHANTAATKEATSALASEDNAVTVTSILRSRAALRQQVWGIPTVPRTLPVVVPLKPSDPEWSNVISEMGLGNFFELGPIYKLAFTLAAGETAVGYQFVARRRPKRLVIVHQGHSCTFGPAEMGLGWLIAELLRSGYSVATLYMPRPAGCQNNNMVSYHQQLFASTEGKVRGSPLQLFVGPAAQTVNYAFRSGYTRVDMVGISGGGWTTTVYAALDPRIKLSIPVAGTFPRHLPCGINVEDPEQNAIRSYMNLYVLGSVGPGRRQIQVLNEYDSCCFKVKCDTPTRDNEPEIRKYEDDIMEADKKLGGGNFSVHIDLDSHQHRISADVVHNVILPALRD